MLEYNEGQTSVAYTAPPGSARNSLKSRVRHNASRYPVSMNKLPAFMNMRNQEREARFSVSEYQVHVAFRDADRRIVPCYDYQGCGAARASGLAYRQGSRQNLHAMTSSRSSRNATAAATAADRCSRRRMPYSWAETESERNPRACENRLLLRQAPSPAYP